MKYVAFGLVTLGACIMVTNGLGVLGVLVAVISGYICGSIKH
jgi:hypothetical protein